MISIIKNPSDEVFVSVKCEAGLAYDLVDHFSFLAPNYKHHPLYKARRWDGRIKLYNAHKGKIYAGLVDQVIDFAKEREVPYELIGDFNDDEFSNEEAAEFVTSLNVPSHIAERDYQIETFAHCIRKKRALFISPTASGKSFMIYMIMRKLNLPTLIIVPRADLIHQMTNDFKVYGYDVANIHQIYQGKDKDTEAPVVISTWQSIYKMDAKFFSRFKVIIGDEAHRFKAKSLISIMEKTVTIPYRFGFTGTLDGTTVNKRVLEGLFGPYRKIVSTKELIDQGYLAKLSIKTILMKYPDDVRKAFKVEGKKMPYKDEVNWLIDHPKRNKLIINMVSELKGNTLVLFRHIKHGQHLYDILKEKLDRKVYLVYGKIDPEERDWIKNLVNDDTNAVVVASQGCFSDGVNIPNLNNIILASPSKSRISIMQMIGRGLRKTNTKLNCTFYDLADDLSWKKRVNHTLLHYVERLKYYGEEEFDYKQYRINL